VISGFRSFGMLCSVDWYLVTDVSGHPIGPVFKNQEVQEGFWEELDEYCY